ncbi:MAG: hypothetical protein P9L93_02020 [Candidatus Gorgyraea atricola]|nr:hypothetical protein [Candidatus Gorgyraea atricola]
MASIIDKLFSLKSDIQLKALAIAIFGSIAIIMCLPLIQYRGAMMGSQQVAIITLAIFGIIIVILSDRITSLNISKDKLNITLAELKKNVKETIDFVRSDLKEVSSSSSSSASSSSSSEDISNIQKKLSEVESLMDTKAEKESAQELFQDATNIGQAMGMLQEIMKSYKEICKK